MSLKITIPWLLIVLLLWQLIVEFPFHFSLESQSQWFGVFKDPYVRTRSTYSRTKSSDSFAVLLVMGKTDKEIVTGSHLK